MASKLGVELVFTGGFKFIAVDRVRAMKLGQQRGQQQQFKDIHHANFPVAFNKRLI